MPVIISDISRKHLRWYFAAATQPPETQASGVPVKLKEDRWFGRSICQGVVKDISLGGAGILVPSSKQIPDMLITIYDSTTRIKAEVIYRRPVSDKLTFLGLRWVTSDREKHLRLLRRLSKKAFRVKNKIRRSSSQDIGDNNER